MSAAEIRRALGVAWQIGFLKRCEHCGAVGDRMERVEGIWQCVGECVGRGL